MWAGSLVLATVAPAAIAYVGITSSLICVGFLVVSWDPEHLFLALLFLAGAATAIRSVLQQSALFSANQTQQMDLKRQGDLIGLLLKDYEEQTSDWLWETDAALCLKNPSRRFLQVLGRPYSAVAGTSLGTLLASPAIDGNAGALAFLEESAADHRSFRDHVVPFATTEGPRWWSFSGRPTLDQDGGFAGYRGVATDVTAAKLSEARIAHMAHYDALTDLPNRSFFCSSLDRALRTPNGTGQAILSLDLDGFKAVNDRFGHPAGDAFLIEVAKRLRAIARHGDTIARFGGDEFIILVEDVARGGSVEALCRRTIRSLSMPFDVHGEMVTVGVSIGVAFAPTDGSCTDELPQKCGFCPIPCEGGGARYVPLFRAGDGPPRSGTPTARPGFASGVAARRVGPALPALHQQRDRPRHGLRGADPLESSGARAGDAIGIHSARRRERIGRADRRLGHRDSVPRSRSLAGGSARLSEHFSDPVPQSGSPDHHFDRLGTSGLPSTRLEVEVTESSLLEDADSALGILRQIRSMGVRVALDDFGTGYSSLSYLRRFPFDRIKIDRSFVQQFETQRDSQVIVKAIIAIARGLGMTITAEGVETPGQADALIQIGCEELQGYRFSRPRPADQIAHAYQAVDLGAERLSFAIARTTSGLGRLFAAISRDTRFRAMAKPSIESP